MGSAIASNQVAGSDHRPVIAVLDFSLATGHGQEAHTLHELRQRVFKFVNKKSMNTSFI